MAEFTRAIQKQDTIVTVSDTSRIQGGHGGDTVNIDTVITLTNPEAQAITLVLPTITGDSQNAYLRTLGEVENRQEFQSPIDLEQLDAISEEKRKKLKEQIESLKQQWGVIKEEANQVVLSTINLEAGSQELKFFMQGEITPTVTSEGEIFEFSFIAPQSNFTVTQGRFTMSVIIILPRGAQLHGEPLAISPEGIPSPVLEYSAITPNVDRHILQYSMQYDPIFTIRYKY
ncbi:hypothetical protein ACQKMY_20945 [Peribacillus frigoritolerans]|uniref:hypothetical protein n=1 Tax=Peribacillus frigoritolerans TaxID=450367 RepID=UPI003D03CF5A